MTEYLSSPFLGSVLANIIIAAVLVILMLLLRNIREQLIQKLEIFTALSVGVLLSLIFLGFIPKISQNIEWSTMWVAILWGVLFFYLLETALHFHHCHDLDHRGYNCCQSKQEEHSHGTLMMLGTLLHNLFHGVVLYSAFAISVEFGVGLTIAILLHSIPQNLANFIMNHRKFQSIILAAMGGILGALLCYPFGDFILAHKFIILGITAGGLLYLALTDILPHMDDKGKKFGKFQYFALVIAGILLVQSFDHISESLMGDHHHDDHQVSHGDEHHNV